MEGLNTCLSPPVRTLLQASITSDSAPCFISKGSYLLDWEIIFSRTSLGKAVSNELCTSNQAKDIFTIPITHLAPHLTYVQKEYNDPSMDFSTISKHLEWTHCLKNFSYSWELLRNPENDCSVILATLILTASFEHALGNVFLLKGKLVPFLMRDLLATPELSAIFGTEPIQVLKFLMGNPAAINLRNILWHGFVAPSEIDSRFGLFLIAAAATLGEHLNLTYKEVPKRKLFNFDVSNVLNDFTGNINFRVLKRIFVSTRILPQLKPYFLSSLHLFEQKMFGECLILLLPGLECTLRCLFASVNGCPERILTAESEILYTTLDEILSRKLTENKDNILIEKLGKNTFEMLLDVFNYQHGPRVRDRLSHGETNLQEVPSALASHLLHLSAIVCLQCGSTDDLKFEDPSLAHGIRNYKAHFHPTSLLVSKVKLLVCDFRQWDVTPKVLGEAVGKHLKSSSFECFQKLLLALGLDEGLRLTLEVPSNVLHSLEELLTSLSIITLFRPRRELEIVSILQQISTNTLRTSINIRNFLQDKHDKFINRKLRSRQRNNYLKLLNSYQSIYEGLIVVSMFIIFWLKSVNNIESLGSMNHQKLIKFLKKTVQHTENIEVLSNIENNEWEKIMELQSKFCTLLLTFPIRE